MTWSNLGPRRTRNVWFGTYMDPCQGGSFLCDYVKVISFGVSGALGDPPFWDGRHFGARILLEDEC
jgi:hypothetical protein